MRYGGRMKSLFNVVLLVFGVVLVSVAVIAGAFFIFSIVTEYRPDPAEPVKISGAHSLHANSGQVFSLITWNIGYGGLGSEMDFFYDGGKRVRAEKSYFDWAISRIGEFLEAHDSLDFILLQEVDRNSKRSYFLDEVEWLKTIFPDYAISFAANYDCRFVPVPVTSPMGRVLSGMTSCSRVLPDEVIRVGFDRHVAWPERLFYMKRCFMASRYSLPDGHQLVVVNIHNSAFDTGGTLRQREMEMIGQFMLAEYAAGNYLVAGGDWNANPPGFDPLKITTGDLVKKDEFTNLATFLPGWQFVHDPEIPTNRNVDKAYQRGSTPVTIIDFFLVSPNVSVLDIRAIPTGFEASDHQPVYLQIALSTSI